MIEINLQPGASRKAKGRMAGLPFAGMLEGVRSNFRDPWMISTVVSVVAAVAAVGFMYTSQSSRGTELGVREEQAEADSARYAVVLQQRVKAEAQRDSVQAQLTVIRAIDADRFVWPHVMDEVSRALPPYTWLKSLSAVTPPPGTTAVADSTAPKEPEPVRFSLTGNTVDIQALTRFMKLLEASPFIQHVTLARSEMAMVDGKEVTEFQLDAQYERPDPAAITTVPVSLSVR